VLKYVSEAYGTSPEASRNKGKDVVAALMHGSTKDRQAVQLMGKQTAAMAMLMN